ncbi:Inner membrane symporter YicJ [Botrimarina colliarenosi]|uniref:Inner membrane symporter YicJ n=1 Tax=Botrimarina colliarenosi TaxID=2528001 RepID=A0A5C5ZZ90_9BACT|nr:MFS transporter [Botrimarina colliarenosi]TWT92892.1 Inner membrane symporter YicJ [Botrimarina colliarenosi]
MTTEKTRLPLSEKIGYGLGDCAANFVFQTQLIFLTNFYTDVLGVAATAVGWMFLFSRLFDAVNDPLMGALADRTNTRWGKFRPWLLWTAIPFAVCFVLAYTTPDLDARGKIIWAYVTYNLLMIAYTANNIPYASLSGVMTPDPVERTSLMSWRFLLAMTAAFFVQTYTLDLVEYFGQGDVATGYQLTMAMWAAIATLFFVITFVTTKERVQPPPSQKSSIVADMAGLVGNRSWVVLSVATLFYFIYLSMRGSIGLYYFKYLVQREDLFGWFNGLGLLASLVGILLSKPLSIRYGKLAVFKVSLLLTVACTCAFYWLPTSAPASLIAMQCLLQFVYGVGIPLLWAMIADVADLSELRTGRRATAMTFAATVFALKLGLSIGGALSLWLLSEYGYVANVEQTAQSLEGIRLMMSLFPALAFVVAWAVLWFYEIDRDTEFSLNDQLAARRDEERGLTPSLP